MEGPLIRRIGYWKAPREAYSLYFQVLVTRYLVAFDEWPLFKRRISMTRKGKIDFKGHGERDWR